MKVIILIVIILTVLSCTTAPDIVIVQTGDDSEKMFYVPGGVERIIVIDARGDRQEHSFEN